MFATLFDVFLDLFWPKNITSRDGYILLMGVQKLTWSSLNGGVSEEGLLKDKFAFFEAYKSPSGYT